MYRDTCPPRENWAKIVESQGLAFHKIVQPEHLPRPYWDESAHYVLEMDEVLALEDVVEDLHKMCLDAVDHVVENRRYDMFGIPAWVHPLIDQSWRRRDPHVYGRFDLRYDGTGPAKLLEYNADTPTSLVESAVAQWFWLKDVYPADDQWNSLHERLIDRWKELDLDAGPVHFAWTSADETGEEAMTTVYLQETATQAGYDSVAIAMEDIGWNLKQRRFVDLKEHGIRTLFKLYPWEWIVTEKFGQNIGVSPTRWIEPIWKMLLSNKAILALLWELNPGHPNLLPAYLGSPGDLTSYISKPLLGREGASMQIVTPDGLLTERGGPYGKEGYVYQEFQPLPEFDGQRPALGAWVVGDEAAGLGIRETVGFITDDSSSFVPHRIAL